MNLFCGLRGKLMSLIVFPKTYIRKVKIVVKKYKNKMLKKWFEAVNFGL